MGAAESEAGRHDDELRHEVHLTKWFYLSVHSVTQGQWHRLMGTKPWCGKKYVREGVKSPATYVTWSDAVEFCIPEPDATGILTVCVTRVVHPSSDIPEPVATGILTVCVIRVVL